MFPGKVKGGRNGAVYAMCEHHQCVPMHGPGRMCGWAICGDGLYVGMGCNVGIGCMYGWVVCGDGLYVWMGCMCGWAV